MSRLLPILLALPLVVAYGVVEGFWSNRWGTSAAVREAVARLRDVPLSVGDWEGQQQEMDPREFARAEIDGYLMRRYVHRETRNAVNVLIVCGRPGPVSLHPPDVCYRGAGFQLAADKSQYVVEGPAAARPAQFWVGLFKRTEEAIPEQLRIYWAWTGTGEWHASKSPRSDFAGSAVLYKLYVIYQPQNLNESPDKDPAPGFLREFLPQLNQCLFEVPSAKDETPR